MPPRLRVHSIAVADPSRAAHQVTTAALGDAPRGRPLLLAVARWGPHPGLRPSAWVMDGVLRAIHEAALNTAVIHLGQTSITDPLSIQIAAAGLESADPTPPTIALRPVGSRRALRLPQAWVGSNLCIVVPCIHRHRPGTPGPAWRGPIGTALVELAAGWGGAWTRDPVELAARSMSEIFAHISVVIDSSWWAPLTDDEPVAPFLLAPERAIGLRLLSPTTTDAAVDVHGADTWIGLQFGLPLRRRIREPLRLVGPAARLPWPKLPRSRVRSGPARLANQALDALWRRNDGSGLRRAALPPAVPGSLAPLWNEYADVMRFR